MVKPDAAGALDRYPRGERGWDRGKSEVADDDVAARVEVEGDTGEGCFQSVITHLFVRVLFSGSE